MVVSVHACPPPPEASRDLDALAGGIIGSQLAPGQRLRTEVDLVDQFKASRLTGTRAMQRLVADGLVERRPRASTFVRKETHSAAKLLGLIIPGLGETEIFVPLCSQIAAESTASHCARAAADRCSRRDE